MKPNPTQTEFSRPKLSPTDPKTYAPFKIGLRKLVLKVALNPAEAVLAVLLSENKIYRFLVSLFWGLKGA